MRYFQMGFTVLALIIGSPVGGLAAAKHPTMQMARYVAIEACTREAQAKYPDTGDSLTTSRNRMFAYVACIRNKGFAP